MKMLYFHKKQAIVLEINAISLAPDNLLLINQYKCKNMKNYLTLKYDKLKKC